MSRDFRAELSPYKCWDARTQRRLEAYGEPLEDCILQNREELIGLCELIEEKGIRSYLEVGIWTGRLLSTLDEIFAFDRIAACDHGWAEACGLSMVVPARTELFRGDSAIEGYHQFRASLGPIDLVFIDANHKYHAVRRDFEINRSYPIASWPSTTSPVAPAILAG